MPNKKYLPSEYTPSGKVATYRDRYSVMKEENDMFFEQSEFFDINHALEFKPESNGRNKFYIWKVVHEGPSTLFYEWNNIEGKWILIEDDIIV